MSFAIKIIFWFRLERRLASSSDIDRRSIRLAQSFDSKGIWIKPRETAKNGSRLFEINNVGSILKLSFFPNSLINFLG
jgi:hypothetical protein